jgi:hypothetical protein|tara:strand:- start:1383 stop:1724 length:342 start_codon:yes stop_codon:yes gene_type:complete
MSSEQKKEMCLKYKRDLQDGIGTTGIIPMRNVSHIEFKTFPLDPNDKCRIVCYTKSGEKIIIAVGHVVDFCEEDLFDRIKSVSYENIKLDYYRIHGVDPDDEYVEKRHNDVTL